MLSGGTGRSRHDMLEMGHLLEESRKAKGFS
jgi:hypothetical protein